MAKDILDDQFELIRQLDKITSNASKFFSVPYAMINLVTSDRIIFKSCTGLNAGDSLDRNGSFCSTASEQDNPLVITDATQDVRFKTNPLVVGVLKIRSYAGQSLHAPDGTRIGTLCLLDTRPRKYTIEQLSILSDQAKLASVKLFEILNNKSVYTKSRTN
jgi:GAF domain-containing protein